MLASMRRAVLAALVAGLALTGSAAAQAGEDGRAAREPLRVLFVGNSLTATNDLPAIVAALGAAAKRVPIEYATVAPGGVNLEDHWSFTGARDALLARPWDVVVLQQGPSSLPESQVDLRTWAVRWAELAREHGIRTAMLTVWPEAARSYAFPAVVGRLPAGEEQVEVLGEAEPSHQVARQVPAANLHPVGVGLRDPADGGSGGPDLHAPIFARRPRATVGC